MHACATHSRRRKWTTSEATKLVRTLVRWRAKSPYDGLMLDRTSCLVGNIAASTLGVGHRFTIAGVEPRVDLGERPLTCNICECAPNRSLQQRILWAPRQCVPWWPTHKQTKLTPSNRKTKKHSKYTDTSKRHNHGYCIESQEKGSRGPFLHPY